MRYDLSSSSSARAASGHLTSLIAQDKYIEIKVVDKSRTDRQNASMHLFFQLLATELNDSGLSMMKVLKQEAEIPWQAESIKEYLWRPIQEAQTGKKSTTKLDTKEVGEVYETLNRHLGERFNVHVPFPSIDYLIVKEEGKQ